MLGFGLWQFSEEVRAAPPARFIGSLDAIESPRIRVFWREPGSSWERLPAEGFFVRPRPYQGDATGRIVGAGLEPELPVLWSESDGAFRLELLPSLDGGGRGGAYGIDGDVIAGWSDDGGGARQAVVWIERDGVFVPQKLPRPADALRCDHAIAMSGRFVAGECVYAAGRGVSVVSQRADDATWTVCGILQPLDGDEDSEVVGLAGTLAAGSSSLDSGATPVAWRIAASEGAAGD